MGEGTNLEYYTTYLHYMNADDFIEYYMNYAHPGSQLIKKLENDSKIINQAEQFQKQKVERTKQSFSTIYTNSYASMNYNVNPGQVTASKKQYKTTTGYLEGSCVIIPITTTLSSRILFINKYILGNTILNCL